jgi:hypothetical protein
MGISANEPDATWQAFIAGPVYAHLAPPWHADPAFAVISEHPGLRDNIGGRIVPVLTLAVELVYAMTGIDLLAAVQAHRPAQGLCLGFGMNALEPYDLLQGFALDRVHAYEWIAEQVIEAAQTLQTLRADDPLLPTRIRLHHGTISNLQAITDASIGVIYTANVFNWEIPMMPETFAGVIQEILRVLTDGGVLLSRGSAGILEEHLACHGRMVLSNQLVSVFQKERRQADA